MQRRHLLPSALALAAAVLGGGAHAEVTVSLAPPRAAVTLVVYGNADVTLVREVRAVLLGEGSTAVEVAWPEAAIDGSSVSLRAPEDVTVTAPRQLPGRGQALSWVLSAPTPGPRDLEITYLTSGIDWKPFYRLTLDAETGAAELEGLVTVRNRSGQAFEQVAVRLVVGELRLIENLAEAAWRTLPAYRDQPKDPPSAAGSGLSERYVYDLGLLPQLALDDTYTAAFLPATSLGSARIVHRLDPARFADGVHKVALFGNAAEAGLGSLPLAAADAQVALRDGGATLPQPNAHVPYTPVGEECEIDLGPCPEVVSERRVARRQRTDFEFDRFGQVEGFDDREWIEVELRNSTDHPVTIEYTDNVPGVWDVAAEVPFVEEGTNEVTFRLEMAPRSEETLSYRLVKRQGKRVRLGPVRPK